MTLPNFIIIGAGRSGTTALYNYLGQHPDVFMSPVKETGFFAWRGEPPDHIKVTVDLARTYPIRSLDAYEAMFTDAGAAKSIGEATPRYLFVPNTAARIFAVLPDVRLIVVLRNPVDRAFASYLGHWRAGRETRSFETVVNEELLRCLSDFGSVAWHDSPAYFYAGLYFRHLTHYLEVFHRQQLHICLYDDFQNHNAAVLQGICRFLKVDPHFEFDTSVRYNVSGVPRSNAIEKLTGKSRLGLALKTYLPKLIRDPAYRFAMNLRSRNVDRPEIPPASRARLLDYYRNDIHSLQTLLKRDLSAWLADYALPEGASEDSIRTSTSSHDAEDS